MTTPTTIDEYIAGFPPEVQTVLQAVRATIRAAAPGATEKIAYGIPTFALNGKSLIHFGGFSKHIGLYPTPSGATQFAAELAGYKQGKGSVQFPLSAPMPHDLIRRITLWRVAEVGRL